MPIDANLLTSKLLQVNLGVPPAPPNAGSLRQAFADLSRYDYDTYGPTADGGAIIGAPSKGKQIQIGPVTRNILLPIQLTAMKAIDEIVDCIKIVEARLPVPAYLFVQTSLTAHLPVTGETAGELVDRTLFAQKHDAFNALGPGRFGSGVKVYMTGGHTQLAIEPLLQDSGTLFVQYVTINPIQLQSNALRSPLEAVIRYVENQVRAFIAEAFGEV